MRTHLNRVEPVPPVFKWLEMKMKNKTKISIVSILLTFLLLQNTVLALVLGSEQKNTHAEMKPGETTEFTILFWNIEDTSIPIRLKPRHVPEDMSVTIQPEEFLLNYSKVTSFPAPKGRDYVNTQYGLMLTTPVKVLVKVGESVETGEYVVYVTATSGKPTTGISILFEKTFLLSIKVTEPPKPPEPPESGIIQTISEMSKDLTSRITKMTKDLPSKLTGMATAATAKANVVILFLSIVSILVIAWFIHKRA